MNTATTALNLTTGTVSYLATAMALAVDLGASKFDGTKSTLAWWTGRRIWSELPISNLRGAQLSALRTAFAAGWFQAQMMGKP